MITEILVATATTITQLAGLGTIVLLFKKPVSKLIKKSGLLNELIYDRLDTIDARLDDIYYQQMGDIVMNTQYSLRDRIEAGEKYFQPDSKGRVRGGLVKVVYTDLLGRFCKEVEDKQT